MYTVHIMLKTTQTKYVHTCTSHRNLLQITEDEETLSYTVATYTQMGKERMTKVIQFHRKHTHTHTCTHARMHAHTHAHTS